MTEYNKEVPKRLSVNGLPPNPKLQSSMSKAAPPNPSPILESPIHCLTATSLRLLNPRQITTGSEPIGPNPREVPSSSTSTTNSIPITFNAKPTAPNPRLKSPIQENVTPNHIPTSSKPTSRCEQSSFHHQKTDVSNTMNSFSSEDNEIIPKTEAVRTTELVSRQKMFNY